METIRDRLRFRAEAAAIQTISRTRTWAIYLRMRRDTEPVRARTSSSTRQPAPVRSFACCERRLRSRTGS